jgi:hypothetical protein
MNLAINCDSLHLNMSPLGANSRTKTKMNSSSQKTNKFPG